MCGICGVISPHNRQSSACCVANMLQTLAHRGPDGQRVVTGNGYSLGHARLAIIDIEGGVQPMQSSDGRYLIVFNGEIYNYLELRQELVRSGVQFKTFSDTEVLLQLWAQKQEKALQQLNGMFAFCVYDTVAKTATLVRDHLGIKPLYYSLTKSNQLVFGSEIKALLQHEEVEAEYSRGGVADYLVFQLCLDSQTMFEGVNKLEPGKLIRFSFDKPNEVEVETWWNQNYSIDTHHTEEFFNDNILVLLQNSVSMQLRSDVPVGSYLSGGMDSSTVTALAARNYSGEFHCFTGRFQESAAYDESAYAKILSDKVEAQLHTVTPTASDFVSSLPNIIYSLDEPVAGPGAFPQFLVSKLAKEHVTVVLGGQGGDEIFGGYARYLVAYLEQALRGAIFETQHEGRFVVTLESMIPNLPALQQYVPMLKSFWAEGLFDDVSMRYFRLVARNNGLRSMLTKDAWSGVDMDQIFNRFESIFSMHQTPSSINKMLNFDQKTLLPALLHVEDRASMSVSLESRVPLLDYRLVELLNSMPPTIKFKSGKLKYSLQKAVTSLLPSEIVNRKDKMGFPVPLGEWSKNGPVREFIFDILGDSRTKQRGLYNPDSLEAMLADENPFSRQLWGALCLELWFRTFIDKKGYV